jgi:hypothetical protein
MNIFRNLVLLPICYSLTAHGQSPPSAKVPFAGCYKVVSQTWHPGNEDEGTPIPNLFQLRNDVVGGASSGIYDMRRVPPNADVSDKQWVWQPKGDRLWLSWGYGLGGIRGTLKRSASGEFVGKVKEYCDSRCEWKKQVATIKIRQVECTH